MYEHRKAPPLNRSAFATRLVLHAAVSILLLGFALGVGVLGYHYVAGLTWLDSLLNASMILGGMGPVDVLKTDPAKWFASAYALFSGLVFIGTAGVLLTPVAHRILHVFHWDEGQEKTD